MTEKIIGLDDKKRSGVWFYQIPNYTWFTAKLGDRPKSLYYKSVSLVVLISDVVNESEGWSSDSSPYPKDLYFAEYTPVKVTLTVNAPSS